MSKNMRIYIAIATFFPLVGGAETQCHSQAYQLRKQGYETTIITFRHEKSWSEQDVIDDVPVIRVAGGVLAGRERLPRVFQKLSYVLALVIMSWTLWRHRSRYDILHVSHLSLLALAAAFAARLARKPLLVVVQGASVGQATTIQDDVSLIAGPLDPATPWLRLGGRSRTQGDLASLERQGKFAVRWTRSLLRSANAVVVVLTGRMKEYLVTHNFSFPRVHRIPNGVNITLFRPFNSQPPLLEQTQTVVCVSRLSYEKGIDVLLQAWRIVQDQAPQARLIIVGTGPLTAQLKRLAEALNLTESVTFAGLQRNVEVQFQRGSVAVLPSRIEGMPNALLEAMACGRACVATRVSGSEDIIQPEINGLLVESEDYQSLAQALLRLLLDPKLAQNYGQAARATVERDYSLEHVTDMYAELYLTLAGKTPAISTPEKAEENEYIHI